MSLLKNKNFMALWVSSSITSFGGQISMLAIPLTAAVLLHATPLQMGWLVALESIPFALLSLHAGAWLDRRTKLPVLRLTEGLLALLLFMIPLLYWLGKLNIWVLYAIAFMIGCVFCVMGVAAQVLLTAVVGREHLVDANSKFMGTESAARLLGPGMAGGLIQWLTAPIAIALDAIAVFCSVVLLSFIKIKETVAPATGNSMWGDIKQGLRMVWGHHVLRNCTLAAMLWIGLFQGYLTLSVLLATRDLGLTAGQLGLAHVGGGVGALAATLSANRFGARFGPGYAVIGGLVCAGVAWVLMSMAPKAYGFWALTVAFGLLDFGAVLYWIHYSSLRQAITPDALLSRVTATMRWLSVLAAPFGALLSGVVAEVITVRTTLMGLGVLMLLATVGLWFSPVRRVSAIPLVPDAQPSA